MVLGATTAIHWAPKATAMTRSATVATICDERVSTDYGDGDFSFFRVAVAPDRARSLDHGV
jgi:hypothetical protein